MGYTRMIGITTIIVTVIRTLVGVWLVATAAAMEALLLVLAKAGQRTRLIQILIQNELQRIKLGIRYQKQCILERVPLVYRGENRNSCHDRLDNRKHNLEENLHDSRTVNLRGFLQFAQAPTPQMFLVSII